MNKIKVIFLLSGLVFMVSATLPKQNKFKNLQVLPKDITEEQLDKVMDHFSHSLGVNCDYCHAKGKPGELDFASDKKPEKEIARKMFTMTADINNKYFNFTEKPITLTSIQAVSCFTCHKGNPRPVNDSIPSVPEKK